MAQIIFEGRKYLGHKGETVLDTLLRQGKNPPYSCRNGACLVCLQRCVKGTPTKYSQKALRPSLQKAGYFLPCVCVPDGNLDVAPPREADLYSRAVVTEKEFLAPDICRLRLEPSTPLYYHAGQFINVKHPNGLTRSYSLASVPMECSYLELHVKHIPGGVVSSWIIDTLAVGDELEFHGPHGKCYYVHGSADQNILLIGNGTGAAPLLGIVRDAILTGHEEKIMLFHGSRTAEGLYLHKHFKKMAQRHANFSYFPCVSGDQVPSGYLHGRAHTVAFHHCHDLHHWQVFTAGHPHMVEEVKTTAHRLGAAKADIRTDPYEIHAARTGPSVSPIPEIVHAGSTQAKKHSPSSKPDVEMWHALDEGKLLRKILTDFYTQVFADPVLAPYFHGSTKERLIGQVFSFMRDHFTGENQYFGARPRAAHHWMVISDEIFDYREKLMVACLQAHNLPKKLINRWIKFEEPFRSDIVKAVPWTLVMDGVEMPLHGFQEIVTSVGTVCDGCKNAIESGETVRYLNRLGLTYCSACSFTNPEAVGPTQQNG
ncbi:MAG: FAD-binding oxidoreductase [Nitrospira sp.]|nr:FAD-binding oxidoreductase [Nitrospira sp.]